MNGVAHVGREAGRDPLFQPMVGVFVGGGMLNAVEALLVPRLRLTLDIDYAQALSVQLAYYASYLAFAYPAAVVAACAGAMRATAIGCGTIALGTLAIALALDIRSFGAMFAALLLTSAGVTILQIACNGVMATRDGGAAGFTALQGFNSLGTVIGPLVATGFLLGIGGRDVALVPFAAFALGFAMLAAAFLRRRHLLPQAAATPPSPARIVALLRRPTVARGAVGIFAYVGAEVTIGSLVPSYLMLGDRGALDPVSAGRLVSLYWLAAMVGRFAGARLLRRLPMSIMLAAAATGAIALTACAVLPTGVFGAVALIAVGLANSIMFPTIFALAMPAEARDVPAASMLLCIAVVGGAIVPVATGLLADRGGLALSLVVPLVCYGVILASIRRGPAAA